MARVGILGNHNARNDGETNATIGARHEFGTSSLPTRSFLRLPITLYLEKALAKSGAFTKDALKEVVEKGSIRPWLEKTVLVAEGLVLEAFATRGFSTWVESNMAGKTNQQTLIETGQLVNSISSDVVGD